MTRTNQRTFVLNPIFLVLGVHAGCPNPGVRLTRDGDTGAILVETSPDGAERTSPEPVPPYGLLMPHLTETTIKELSSNARGR